jgi:hypothetical protein
MPGDAIAAFIMSVAGKKNAAKKATIETTTDIITFLNFTQIPSLRHNALPRGKCERCWAKPSEIIGLPHILRHGVISLLPHKKYFESS